MNRPALSHSAARRGRHGMVLFEVITALFVFTLVAFSLVLALNSAFEAATERNEIAAAILGLNNRIALLHANRLLPGESDLPDDGSGITYRLSVSQLQLQDQKHQPVPNIYKATITASWKSNGEVETREVSELLYQP